MTDVVERVADAIWNIRREEEDKCDLELKDLSSEHSVWNEARAAIVAMQEYKEENHSNEGTLPLWPQSLDLDASFPRNPDVFEEQYLARWPEEESK